MKRWTALIGLMATLLVSGAAQSASPVLSSLDAPYGDLQNATPINLAGQSWAAGTVAYGPTGTPLVLSGVNLGDNGTVWFVSYKNGTVDQSATVQAPVSLWTPTAVFFSVPGNAKTGLVELVTGGQVSNGLPFAVMTGAYSGSCPKSPPPNSLRITTTSLPNGTQNQVYSARVSATGGSGNYTWTLVRGTLPSPLVLSTSGTISGTPTTSTGPVNITVQVADSSSPRQFDTVTLSIQIAAQAEGQSSTALYSFSITGTSGNSGYDPAGNITSYTDSVNGTWSFSYDLLHRLATASGSQANNAYPNYCWQYDSFGNRLWQKSASTAFATGNGGSNACTVSGAAGPSFWASYNTSNTNRIDSSSVNSGQSQYYDAAGDITYDGTNSYLYDGEGRICAERLVVPGVGTTMTQYVYDASGNRVGKGTISAWTCDTTGNGFINRAAYVIGLSGEQLSELTWNAQTNSWQAAHSNVDAAGELIATYDADSTGQTEGNLYFHLSDWLGSRRQQTDYAGNPGLNFTGLPFGDGLSTISVSGADVADATEHHFTGKERDQESGNDYFGARYYSSSMGRWMSPDPYNPIRIRQGMEAGGLPTAAAESFFYGFLGNPQNLNQYSYVRNNPLRLVDPTGSAPVDGHHLITGRSQFPAGSLARDFTEAIKTGNPDKWPNQPGFNAEHVAYNEGVADALAEAEESEGSSTYWDLSQWKAFATSILKSGDPRIKGFLDDLEQNNPGAKAALAASIAAYRLTALTLARIVAAGVAASVAARAATVSDFIVCFSCSFDRQSVTHKIIYGPPPQD